MLDDFNVLKQRDSGRMLEQAAQLPASLVWQPEIANGAYDARPLSSVVFAGMGGSALAADIACQLLGRQLPLPFCVIRDYELPEFARENTLVIALSYSGNSEETLSTYAEARQRGCQTAVIAADGKLLELARADDVVNVVLPGDGQPRMATIALLKGIFGLLQHFGIIDSHYNDELTAAHEWLAKEMGNWHHQVPVHENYAKQFALLAVGKTPIFYAGPLTAPLAYKLKISWNENAKNTAFSGTYPEFNHNEFIGWSSHPIEKPFFVVDLISDQERPRIAERMRLSDRLLSGRRPKATELHLHGETYLRQALWVCAFANFASIYVAILNNTRFEDTSLVEKLKNSLE